jgi:hypothetical protein
MTGKMGLQVVQPGERDAEYAIMGRIARLTLAQRIVIVIGLGAVACIVGTWLTIEYEPVVLPFGYAPRVFVRRTAYLDPAAMAAIWVVLAAVWTVASVLLLGRPIPTDGNGKP